MVESEKEKAMGTVQFVVQTIGTMGFALGSLYGIYLAFVKL